MSRCMREDDCAGCRDDFYNHRADMPDAKCWSFDANKKLVKKKPVHINDEPPWRRAVQWVPPCFHKPQWIYVKPEVNA